MTIDVATSNQAEREPLSALSKLTLGALVGSGLAISAVALRTGTYNRPLMVQAAVALAAVGTILSRFRWAPLVGGILAVAMLLATGVVPVARAYAAYHLSHPAQATDFALTLVRIACLFVAATAGIGTVVQNAQVKDPQARRAPSWTGLAVGMLAGVVAGATLVSTLVAASGPAPAAKGTRGAIVVHLGPNSFTPAGVDLPVGSKVLMVDDAPIPHLIRNGRWLSTGGAQAAREPGAPAVDLTITNGSVQAGPFSKAGVYRLYCTVHPGMNLILRVQ